MVHVLHRNRGVNWRQFVLSMAMVVVVACERSTPAPAPIPTPTTQAQTQTETQVAPAPAPTRPEATSSPSDVVKTFGERMKDVSTTAPRDAAAASIRKAYEGLVQRELIDAWIAAPEKAPGRQVSSPWPDRIEIESSSIEGNEASVSGELVEATSTGDARRLPVQLKLALSGGKWLITAYEESSITGVLEDYYRAISARDYKRAYRAWGENGPPGQDYETFVKGFEHTASVAVKTGTPSRVEAAAGSRYVTVPVTITATTTSGEREGFEGTYTLRRSVVDGATDAQRRWHLYKASIRRQTS